MRIAEIQLTKEHATSSYVRSYSPDRVLYLMETWALSTSSPSPSTASHPLRNPHQKNWHASSLSCVSWLGFNCHRYDPPDRFSLPKGIGYYVWVTYPIGISPVFSRGHQWLAYDLDVVAYECVFLSLLFIYLLIYIFLFSIASRR